MAAPLIQSFEPATGALHWEGEASDLDAEVAIVDSGWMRWAAQSLTYRIETLRRYANGVRAAEDKFADIIARETGKPLWEARAEVASLPGRIDTAAGAYSERTGQRRLEGALGLRQSLRHKPHGVVAVITPHVMPAQIPNDRIVAALIAGNGVLFKPSHHVPATALMLTRLLHEAGVPQEALRCVLGGVNAGKALAADERVRATLFTGSSQSGLALARANATRPDRLLAMSMGGNNPIVVWDMGDLATAAMMVVQSAFAMSGQHCMAARRLIVQDILADDLIDEIKMVADRLVLADPHADPAPFMGPVIDMDAADGLTESFLYLMSNGGRPIKHMQRPYDGLPFVTPAIIDVTAMTQRPDIELFGPLLQIVRVKTFEEAVAEANNSRYGLVASLIGNSAEQYDRFWANCRAGVVNWNRPTILPIYHAPAGGVGLSGNHRPAGSYAADHCAYPVVSAETEQQRASIGIGLKPRAFAQVDH